MDVINDVGEVPPTGRSRVLYVDFTLFNPTNEFLSTVRLAVEFTTASAVYPSADIQTFHLYGRQATRQGFFLLAVDIVLLLSIFVFLVQMIQQIRRRGWKAFFDFSNMLHLFNLFCFFSTYFCWLKAEFLMPNPIDGVDYTATWIDYRSPVWWVKSATEINAVNIFLSWMKGFDYLAFIPQFRILLGTLGRAMPHLFYFMIILGIVLYSSSLSFMLIFASSLPEYRSQVETCYTLLSSMMGDFDVGVLRDVSPVLGPLMWLVYQIVMVFVMMNMLIAIISEAFIEEQAEIKQEQKKGLLGVGALVIEIIWDAFVVRIPLLGPCLDKAFGAQVKFMQARKMKMIRLKAVQIKLVAAMDKDNDGKVDARELLAEVEHMEGSGNLNRFALDRVFRRVGISNEIQRRDLVEEIFMFDEDGDGTLDLMELHTLLEGLEEASNFAKECGVDFHGEGAEVNDADKPSDLVPHPPLVGDAAVLKDVQATQVGMLHH